MLSYSGISRDVYIYLSSLYYIIVIYRMFDPPVVTLLMIEKKEEKKKTRKAQHFCLQAAGPVTKFRVPKCNSR